VARIFYCLSGINSLFMKTLLIIIGLVILTIISSYAQNTKNCCCQRKLTHTATVHHKYVARSSKTTPPRFTNRIHNTRPEEVPGTYAGNDVWQYDDATQTAKQENVGVTKESTYTGNYPKPTVQDTRVTPENSKDDFRGKYRGDNLCLWNCR